MCEASQKLGFHRPGTKYLDVEKANLTYRKQHNHFRGGDARESIPDRIVSIAMPYVRPIVHGKEVKSCERKLKIQ